MRDPLKPFDDPKLRPYLQKKDREKARKARWAEQDARSGAESEHRRAEREATGKGRVSHALGGFMAWAVLTAVATVAIYGIYLVGDWWVHRGPDDPPTYEEVCFSQDPWAPDCGPGP